MGKPLWISGEIQADVDDDFGPASHEVEAAMNAALLGLDFGKGFNSLNLVPIIRLFDSTDYDEIRKYHKKRRDFEFRLKIPHASFKTADEVGQRRLVVKNILQAITEMRKMAVRDVDCDKLEHSIRAVAAEKGWL